MFGFMFSVLGSVVFWVFYIVIGLFIASVMFKKFAPKSYAFIKSGKRDIKKHGDDSIIAFVSCSFFMVLWPVCLMCVLIWYVFKLVIFKFFAKAICFAAESVPEFKIVKKGDETDESKSN